MENNLLVIIAVAAIVGAAGFLVGMKYQQTKTPLRADFQRMRGARPELPGGPSSGAEMIRGEIIDQDEEGITVKLADESTKIVLISEGTKINKATEGTTEDLQSGEAVMIVGRENSDGSVSASQIQLNFDLRRESPPLPES